MTTTKNADIILKAIRAAVEQDSNMQVTARMSKGSKSAAMALVKEVAKHYIRDETLLNNADDFEWAFDTAYAELFGGGCEIEWLTD